MSQVAKLHASGKSKIWRLFIKCGGEAPSPEQGAAKRGFSAAKSFATGSQSIVESTAALTQLIFLGRRICQYGKCSPDPLRLIEIEMEIAYQAVSFCSCLSHLKREASNLCLF